MDHLEINKILTDAQHGFRRRRSCESQLLLCIDDIVKSLDKGEQIDIILLDLKKLLIKCLIRDMGSCPRKTKERCYKTLVRPTIEYPSTVWHPCTSKNIDKLEMIQRRAARFVNGSWFASPSNMIADLG